MFCTKCGCKIKDGNDFCTNCGSPVNSVISQKHSETNVNSIPERKFDGAIPLVVFSIILLLCVLILPMHDVWGGLFGGSESEHFGDVLHYIVSEGVDSFDYWVVSLTMTAFIPGVITLIAGLTRCKVLAASSSVIAVIRMLWLYIRIIDQNGLSDLTSFKDCSISIGSHIAIILHVICFFCSLRICKTKKIVPTVGKQLYIQSQNARNVETVFCTNCGKSLNSSDNFCTTCGEPISTNLSVKQVLDDQSDPNKIT